MQNKTVLLTGATSGIGKATALELSKRGYELIVPVRNSQKAEKLIREVVSNKNYGNIQTYKCDFNDFSSIKNFISEIKKDCKKIDILINNAGIWNSERKESMDGMEQTLAVNVLAPYYLATELLPLIEKGEEKRIIFTSSDLHGGAINFEDIEYKNSYIGFLVYQQSKLADMLLTRYLAKEWAEKGITVNCLHPGVIASNLAETNGFMAKLFFSIFGKSTEKGAETIVYLATDNEVKKMSGEYFAKSKVKACKANGKNMEMANKLVAYLDKKILDWEKK